MVDVSEMAQVLKAIREKDYTKLMGLMYCSNAYELLDMLYRDYPVEAEMYDEMSDMDLV